MTHEIRVKGWDDLVRTIPFQLGFRPRDSLVIVALLPQQSASERAAGRLSCHVDFMARVDLPAPAQERGWRRELVSLLRSRAVRMVVLLSYEDTRAGTECAGLLRSLLAECGGDPEATVVRVRGEETSEDMGRSWHPLPPLERVPAVTHLIAEGAVALAQRTDLEALVASDPRQRREVAARIAELRPSFDLRRQECRAAVTAAWHATLAPQRRPVGASVGSEGGRGDPPASEAGALLALGLVDPELRDALLAESLPELFGPPFDVQERSRPDRGAVHRLMRVAAPLPPSGRAPVLTCAAMLAWGIGDGALARVCVEAARDDDPRHRLAALAEGLLDAGVDPRSLIGTGAGGPV